MANQYGFKKTNQVANLEMSESNTDYHQVIQLFINSPLHYAMTANPPLRKNILLQAWDSAKVIKNEKGNPQISLTVNGDNQIFDVKDVRFALQLPTEPFSELASDEEISNMLTVIGYSGDVHDLGKIIRPKVIKKQWSFFFDAISRVFCAKIGGYDSIISTVQEIAYSLLFKDHKTDIGFMIFRELCAKLRGSKSKTIFYPRFLMLIIQFIFPDLPDIENEELFVIESIHKRIFKSIKDDTEFDTLALVPPSQVQAQVLLRFPPSSPSNDNSDTSNSVSDTMEENNPSSSTSVSTPSSQSLLLGQTTTEPAILFEGEQVVSEGEQGRAPEQNQAQEANIQTQVTQPKLSKLPIKRRRVQIEGESQVFEGVQGRSLEQNQVPMDIDHTPATDHIEGSENLREVLIETAQTSVDVHGLKDHMHSPHSPSISIPSHHHLLSSDLSLDAPQVPSVVQPLFTSLGDHPQEPCSQSEHDVVPTEIPVSTDESIDPVSGSIPPPSFAYEQQVWPSLESTDPSMQLIAKLGINDAHRKIAKAAAAKEASLPSDADWLDRTHTVTLDDATELMRATYTHAADSAPAPPTLENIQQSVHESMQTSIKVAHHGVEGIASVIQGAVEDMKTHMNQMEGRLLTSLGNAFSRITAVEHSVSTIQSDLSALSSFIHKLAPTISSDDVKKGERVSKGEQGHDSKGEQKQKQKKALEQNYEEIKDIAEQKLKRREEVLNEVGTGLHTLGERNLNAIQASQSGSIQRFSPLSRSQSQDIAGPSHARPSVPLRPPPSIPVQNKGKGILIESPKKRKNFDNVFMGASMRAASRPVQPQPPTVNEASTFETDLYRINDHDEVEQLYIINEEQEWIVSLDHKVMEVVLNGKKTKIRSNDRESIEEADRQYLDKVKRMQKAREAKAAKKKSTKKAPVQNRKQVVSSSSDDLDSSDDDDVSLSQLHNKKRKASELNEAAPLKKQRTKHGAVKQLKTQKELVAEIKKLDQKAATVGLTPEERKRRSGLKGAYTKKRDLELEKLELNKKEKLRREEVRKEHPGIKIAEVATDDVAVAEGIPIQSFKASVNVAVHDVTEERIPRFADPGMWYRTEKGEVAYYFPERDRQSLDIHGALHLLDEAQFCLHVTECGKRMINDLHDLIKWFQGQGEI